MRKLILWLIKCYRFAFSPWLGQHCRFHPTCSQYMYTAVERHGALRGTWMGLRRLMRCHPFHEGGIDPVPDKAKGSH